MNTNGAVVRAVDMGITNYIFHTLPIFVHRSRLPVDGGCGAKRDPDKFDRHRMYSTIHQGAFPHFSTDRIKTSAHVSHTMCSRTYGAGKEPLYIGRFGSSSVQARVRHTGVGVLLQHRADLLDLTAK